jgi:hypothetical protein
MRSGHKPEVRNRERCLLSGGVART